MWPQGGEETQVVGAVRQAGGARQPQSDEETRGRPFLGETEEEQRNVCVCVKVVVCVCWAGQEQVFVQKVARCCGLWLVCKRACLEEPREQERDFVVGGGASRSGGTVIFYSFFFYCENSLIY